MAFPLDTAVKTIGKQVAKQVGGEVAEGVTKTAWKGVGKGTKKVTQAAPTWSNNDLLTRFKKNSVKHKEAKQFINDLEPYDIDLLTEFSKIEPKGFQAFGDKVELAARDFNPREDHWQEVNGLLIGLEQQVQRIRNQQSRQNFPDELDFTPKDPVELDQAMGVERVDRISAAEKTGTGEHDVSTRLTAGTAEPGEKSFRPGDRKRMKAAGTYPQEIETEGLITILGKEVERIVGGADKIPYKQQHHELIKAYFEPFITRARQLGSELDVVNLSYMADHFGFGLGDYLAAMKMMDAIPHNIAHTALLEEGIQPGTIFKDWNLPDEVARIKSIDNISDLTKEFKKAIEEVGIPMREQMDLWQEAWELIPTQDRIELIRLWSVRHQYPKGSKEYKLAEKPYRELKNKLEAQIKQNKADIDADNARIAEGKQIASEEQAERLAFGSKYK
jgi:hypothetical protein